MSEDRGEERAVPWRGRRRVDDPRAHRTTIRWNDADYAAITAAAERRGLTVGPYLRAVGLGKPGAGSRHRPTTERKNLARLLGALGKLGSNVNQLAKHANTTGELPDRATLERAAEAIEAMRAAMFQVLGR